MSDRKQISIWSSLIWFTLLGFLRPAIHIFLLPLYLLKISPDQYGILSLVLIFAGLVGSLSGLKLDVAANTFYYDYYKKRPLLERYLGQIFTFNLMIGILFFIILYFSGSAIYQNVFSSPEVLFFPFGILAIGHALFSSANSIYYAYLRNELRIKEFVVVNVTAILSTIILQAVFILFYDLGIYGILLGSFIPAVIVFLYTVVKNSWLLRFKVDFDLLKPSLMFGLGFLPISFLVIFERQIDRLLIERFLNLEQVGLYSILLSITGFFTVFLGAFQNAVRPNVYESLKQNNIETKSMVNNVFKHYSSFGVFALASVLLVGNHFYLITDNPKYLKIVEYFPFAVAASIPLIFLRFQILVILFFKKTQLLSVVTVFKTIAMIIVLYLLIPKYGIMGAILALFISYVLYSAVLFFVERTLSDNMLEYRTAISRSVPFLVLLILNEVFVSNECRPVSSIVIFMLTMIFLLIVERKFLRNFICSFKNPWT